MKKPAITQVAIDPTIAERWSGRAYDASKPITQEQTLALLEAARWAPSCMGDQPWRILVWNKGVDAKAWQQAFDCLAEGNQSWVKDAPFLCLICANTLLTKNGQPNRWAEYDTGAAALNLSLQASSMGLSAHQMGGFSTDKARATFSIPEQFTLMAMISVGYLLDIERVTGDLLARETAPRSRRDLGALFFNGAWDKPII
ncbi:MAG: nitroreductase family protein [Candidatus Methylopumilus sp.]|jgi:nitroreductase|nr:nitroreductase family protein [Candidatus Methylopumilus sp.]